MTQPSNEAGVLAAAAIELGLVLSHDQLERLLTYATLLESIGIEAGVVGPSDRGRVAARHVADSLRAAAVLTPAEIATLDLGSGGGLPGIPVAIASPAVTVGLVESRRRRVGFLELACERLVVDNATPIAQRIESIDGEPVDVCFARALAPLAAAWRLAMPLLRTGGRLVYFAGAETDLTGAEDLGFPVEVRRPVAVASGGPLVIIGRP
jgi:16S rRNA (guanine527-N7)-methyltransferase